jgi:general secretion pathway protein H
VSKASRGFTLLELIVVLAIAAIMLAVVLPVGGRRGGRELERAARDVAASLRLVRERAIIANATAALTVDLEHGFYQGEGGHAAAFPRGAEVRLATTTAEEEAPRIGRIRFYPDGSASGGGVLLTRDGERLAVLVDWLTGGVSVRTEKGRLP